MVGTQSPHADLVAMVAGVYIYVKLHFTPGKVVPYTLPELLDAIDVQFGGAPHAVPATSTKKLS